MSFDISPFIKSLEDFGFNGNEINAICLRAQQNIISYFVAQKLVNVDQRVMPMLTETEVRSGWEGWLNNSYKYFEKEFKSSRKTSASRDAVPQTVRIWMGKYYKDLLEITKRYLDASKHSV